MAKKKAARKQRSGNDAAETRKLKRIVKSIDAARKALAIAQKQLDAVWTDMRPLT